MSGELRGQALQHLIKAESQLEQGRCSDALQTLEKAGRLADESQAPDIIFNVAITLNNFGALFSRRGRIDDAKDLYEGALEKYERLLEGDPDNVTYQSYVAGTLNNLGALLSRMGRIDDAKDRYKGALGTYTESMQYMTIRQKARAVLGIIQLVSKSADGATNKIKKSEYFKEVWTTYNQHREFFIEWWSGLRTPAGKGRRVDRTHPVPDAQCRSRERS